MQYLLLRYHWPFNDERLIKVSRRQVRIGIDVGGTFTDAVVIDNETYEIIAKRKIPTTHNSKEGVATGIITIIRQLLEENNIEASDVSFISHGTTQATNALLEGDVAKVGVLGMGESGSAKNETQIGNIELAIDKYLEVYYEYISSNLVSDTAIEEAIHRLIEKGAEVIVASEAFSIEHPEHEQKVIEISKKLGFYATGGYEISQLFGLKLRTRTAVINGSLIPKMMETSNMTEKVVKDLGVQKNLMIMRADGGVMSIQEVRKRPILTMLSGLAAGVAGAIMYEKISDGIFFEIGGTSIDISVIKDGKVMIKNASVGGHKTYLKSVDVRTLGIAGGTMIRVDENQKIYTGPRSAHLANLPYECFSQSRSKKFKIKKIQPRSKDPKDYVVLEDETGEQFAFTLAGAANYLGYIEKNDYSYANNIEQTVLAWETLGVYLNSDSKEVARTCIDVACEQIWKVVEELKQEYELDEHFITLYGGGGSAGVFTHYLGEKYHVKHEIIKNAPYISTIGVALAMISEQIERSVVNPKDEDIRKIRSDILDRMLEMGALRETIEISIEVDGLNHIVRATATGANEMSGKEMKSQKKEVEELLKIARQSVNCESGEAKKVVENNYIIAIEITEKKSKLFGLVKQRLKNVVVITQDGVVKYRRRNGEFIFGLKKDVAELLNYIMDTFSVFSDAGQTIPEIILFLKFRTFDYSGLMNKERVYEIAKMDMEGVDEDERIIFLVTRRG